MKAASTLAVTSSVAPSTKEETLCLIKLYCTENHVNIMLICLALFITLGGIIHIYCITTFIIESYKRKILNVFLACIGLTDCIASFVLAPMTAVLLLPKESASVPLCRVMLFFLSTSTYFVHLMLLVSSIQSYLSVCCRVLDNIGDTVTSKIKWTYGSILICAIVAFGDAYLGDDYCHRLHHGNFTFRVTTTLIITIAPFVMAMLMTLAVTKKIKRRARISAQYRHSQQFVHDLTLNKVNIIAYLILAVSWLPHLVVLYFYRDTSDQVYYITTWIGLSRTLINPLIFLGLRNKRLRQTFSDIYHKCFHRSTLTGCEAGQCSPELGLLESVNMQILQSELQAAASYSYRELAALRESYL